jgi:hypothetical protein
MPTATYDLLASTTLSATTNSVTFGSLNTLAAGYQDLIISIDTAAVQYDGWLGIQLNGDTGSNYTFVAAISNGSITGTDSAMRIYNHLTTTRGHWTINLFDFSVTNKQKIVLSTGGSTAFGVAMTAGRWANTAAITSIKVVGQSGLDFASGGTFNLYGVVG